MRVLPFGQAVLLWRLHRGLTQDALARRAAISRPNLCAIERGRREVSLSTLRALALALQVRPGVLADGEPPVGASDAPPTLSRQRIERIADAVAGIRPTPEPTDRATVQALRAVLGHRTRALRRQWGRPRTTRRADLEAWTWLKSLYGRPAIQMLADRVLERQRAHAPGTD